ncbi:MAG: MMPL family transporter [Oscillospiraceae bacterium]|nr:MMPL family transporter [Oscillospiraceae bacterium]
MTETSYPKPDIMHRIAAAIVHWRLLIILLFLAAAVYCGLSLDRVQVNSDLRIFLSEETETRQGLNIMEDNFITYASEDIMVSNVTYEIAERLAETIRGYEHVFSLSFDRTEAHYAHASALFSVSYDGTDKDEGVSAARAQIRTLLEPYDTYTYSMDLESYSEILAKEMVGVIGISALVIVVILLFTSRSYFEVVIFAIVFVFAALLNMGTNFWLGEISTITHSIAIILQLALAIDYAIIFSHRYQDECLRFDSTKDALVEALAKSIIEISSSSLTTISGLAALTMMQFRLGYDMGMVLSKSILCSLLTVFLLMPGLIMLFPGAIRKTAHRTLIPDITGWGRLLMNSKYCFVWIFLLLTPAALWCSRHVTYAFADNSITELVYSESRTAMHKIENTFARSASLVLLLPHENLEAEKQILQQAKDLPQIRSSMGLAGIEIDGEHVLTDLFNSRMLAELLEIPQEQAALLFQAYGIRNEQYQALFGTPENYQVPLVDMLLFLFDMIDHGVVSLDDEQSRQIEDLRSELNFAVNQLRGESYNRLIFTADVPVEGEKSVELAESLRELAEPFYGQGEVLVLGDITSARDLGSSYTGDSRLISLLTITFVFTILLLTFRTFAGSVILVFVIQGSIWINFSFPYLRHIVPSFVTNMIVSAIQMGATIDYAIVLMNRYLSLKAEHQKKEAMALAVNQSFATVLTSGSILTIAGFLIGFRVSDVYVNHIGMAVGRGALTSVILVLTVLPQLLVLLDGAIGKTTFRIRLKAEDDG